MPHYQNMICNFLFNTCTPTSTKTSKAIVSIDLFPPSFHFTLYNTHIIFCPHIHIVHIDVV